jgi:acetyl esterase/lipase
MVSYVTDTKDPSKWAPASEEFAPMKSTIKDMFEALWAQPIDIIRSGFKETPPALADYIPTDLNITHERVPVSDGSDIEIRIYKAATTSKGAGMFYVSHGGGWVVGSHDVEEAQNRLVAGKAGVVVVSVDYRL